MSQLIKAPTHWASYLVNGDLSGFSEQDEANVLAFEIEYGRCEGVPEPVGFSYCEYLGLAAECSLFHMVGGAI